ncbi:MAG TPA: DNA repair protein RecO [Longimicrobiales bacterium]|nr:DNA repair protein RecO [Longimicrobiales bacterium]
MPIVTDSALILQVYPYSETSKILRLLTRGHGLRSAMARGALRPKSRYGGVLEPFTQGIATIFVKETRELQTLSGFDLERSRQRLGDDLIRFAAASLLAEVVLIAGSEAAEPALYDGVIDWLDRIESADSRHVEAQAVTAAWTLVGALGFAPEIEQCIRCSRVPDTDEETRFDYAAGGILCASCAAGVGVLLPPQGREALASMSRGVVVSLDRYVAYWTLLDRFLAYHVTDGRSLRSLEFLTEARERQ